MGPITEELFETQVQTNAMCNCPMTVDDIDDTRKTFSKLMCALKGNCLRQQPKEVKNNMFIIPQELVTNNHKTELCMDYVAINGMSFLHSTDKMVMLCHITCMPSSKAEDNCNALDMMSQKHNKAGFVCCSDPL